MELGNVNCKKSVKVYKAFVSMSINLTSCFS